MMEVKSDLKQVYEILMLVPNMEDLVTVNSKVKKKNVLLLAQVLMEALAGEDKKERSIMKILSKETVQELKAIADELLHKVGMSDLHQEILKYRG